MCRAASPTPTLDCDTRWAKSFKLWTITDQLVQQLILKINGSPPSQTEYQKAGNYEELETDYNLLISKRHKCGNSIYEEEDEKLLEITKRNIEKTTRRVSSPEEERTDEGYLEWKAWVRRDMEEKESKKERLEKVMRKERS